MSAGARTAARTNSIVHRASAFVMAWNVDRLGRSLKDLVAFLSELHALGIDLFLHQQGLDTTTPAGKAMFHAARLRCGSNVAARGARAATRADAADRRAHERGK